MLKYSTIYILNDTGELICVASSEAAANGWMDKKE